MPIQMMTNAVGRPRPATMKERMVRPREMRAKNIPTKGAHVTVQAQ